MHAALAGRIFYARLDIPYIHTYITCTRIFENERGNYQPPGQRQSGENSIRAERARANVSLNDGEDARRELFRNSRNFI